jgi:hypothetical protein
MIPSDEDKEHSNPVPVNDDILSEKSQDVQGPVDEKDVEEPAYGWVCTACVFFINGSVLLIANFLSTQQLNYKIVSTFRVLPTCVTSKITCLKRAYMGAE